MDSGKKDSQFYFPLYALRYSTDYNKTLNYIISYCIVEYAFRLYSNFVLSSGDNSSIERAIRKNPIENFDYENEVDYYIVFATVRYGIKIYDIKSTLNRHKEIENFISYYEYKHGKDVRVKIHKDLMLEVRDSKFDYNLFRVYCAVKSILGKKAFCRITSDRLRYRMQGFKSKKVFELECCNDKLYTRRQIEARVKKLRSKKLIDTITYRNRIKFFSTRFKAKELEEFVTNSLALSKANRIQQSLRDKRLSENVDLKVKELKEKMINGVEFSDIKQEVISNLRLVK